MRGKLTGLILAISLLNGCSQPVETGGKSGRLRASLDSSEGSPLVLRAWLEGPEGQLLDGALVSLTFPGKDAALVSFDGSRGCYYGLYTSFSPGVYTLQADSLVMDRRPTLEIPFQKLSFKPLPVEIVDSGSPPKRISLGETLDGGTDLLVTWSETAGAKVYQVKVYSGNFLVTSLLTPDPHCIVPKDTLAAGTAGVQVTAQWLEGDPLFRTGAFSASYSLTGPTVQFQVE